MKKKLFAILVACVLAFALTAPIYAVPAQAATKTTAKKTIKKTGLYKSGKKLKYYKNGKFKKVTGLVKNVRNGKWVYVKKGVFQKYTGVTFRVTDGKPFFVKKGILYKKYKGIAKDAHGARYKVKNGKATRIASNGKPVKTTTVETKTGTITIPDVWENPITVTEPHKHTWEMTYDTVHHDAQYKTVRHPAEYQTIHHDAVYEDRDVTEKWAHNKSWQYIDEYRDGHYIVTKEWPCSESYMRVADDAKSKAYLEQANTDMMEKIWNTPPELADMSKPEGAAYRQKIIDDFEKAKQNNPYVQFVYYHTDDEMSAMRHADGHYGSWMVTCSTEYFDKVIGTERVCTKKAWDEEIVVKDAWNENVLVKAAWDEQTEAGYVCTTCGAWK